MSESTRIWRPLSAPRRLIVELMRASRGIPTATAERRFDLGALIEARRHTGLRPAWSVIIAKAFAIVAESMPALRTSFIAFPWPHLCEHADSVVSIAVEREYRGEEVVLFTQIRQPHALSLAKLDERLRRAKAAPVESVANFQRELQLGRMPWPLRGWVMWFGLHASGRWRERHFGTFVVTSPAAAGAGMLQLITPLTCTLHYGLFDEHGRFDVRLTFDHRVLDGAVAARALVALEGILNTTVLDEMSRLNAVRKAA